MAGDDLVKLEYPGLIISRMPSGNLRYLVRKEGDPRKRTTVKLTPADPQFHEAYLCARAGVAFDAPPPAPVAQKGTLGWLAAAYLEWLTAEVEIGTASHHTLKQRKNYMPVFLRHASSTGQSAGKPYEELPADMPTHELVLFRDTLMITPGKAKNIFKMLKAMYAWGVERGHCKTNPAAAVKVAYKSQGGATPWTTADLEAYRNAHPKGTRAHLCLTLFMFSAARIGDVYRLGRGNEVTEGGVRWLKWQPEKKGSRFVEVPMVPALIEATRAQPIVGETYLLTVRGKPYASAESLRNDFKDWCIAAGIGHLSSHGIRKAAGHLMALQGVTQYGVMSVHGHANASTSQVYTDSVERQSLAAGAMATLAKIDW